LAGAVLAAAAQAGLPLREAAQISERPGEGLRGVVDGRSIEVTSRNKYLAATAAPEPLPELAAGLECVLLVDGRYAGTYRFRDEPRGEGRPFVDHLRPRHHLERVLLVSGDRASEVRYLADLVGIHEVFAQQSPEDKVAIVRAESARAATLFVGDGINDAPALVTATVGLAFGQGSDITAQAAGAVILESSLAKVDEFLHISRRMRQIALQSAVGGMALSVAGMLAAAAGLLPPVAGAVAQELIDVGAVLNALRAAWPPRSLTDF
jgi:P-type E1-E2 ATPase